MVKRCRFCGEKIKPDAASCPHCGKTLIANSQAEGGDPESLIGLDSWQNKRVPAWTMYLAVGIALLCVFAMFSHGCDRELESEETASIQIPTHNSTKT